jgi:enoyl-CoA hydratase
MAGSPGIVGGGIDRWIAGVGDGLEVEHRGPVGWLIFDRPTAGNAMDAAMMALLPQYWRALDSDPAVRCIVVTGRGKAFQTGLDVTALAKDPQSLRESTRRTRDADLQLTGWHLGVRTPVLTAVNGICAGGGLHFVVDSDLVIASTRASFVDPHVSLGQVSAWESIGLSRRIPAALAARIALLGAHERLDAERARAIGLISEVVEPGDLLYTAQRLGEIIAAQDPRLTAARKHALWAGLELGREPARINS